MIYVDIGFVEPTKIYEIEIPENKLLISRMMTLDELANYLIDTELYQHHSVLIDNSHPDVIDHLKARGIWAVGVR